MNYYPRYPGDYIKKTLGLSMLEDGAYTRLIDAYYAQEEPIEHARRYALARATTSVERAAVDIVLKKYFELRDGFHHHERTDEEIARAAPRIEAAKANGAKGGRRPKTNPDDNQQANPMGSAKPNPPGNPDESHRASSPTPEPEEVGEKGSPSDGAGASEEQPKPNAYGLMARQLMQRGITRVSSGHLEFRALIDAGATFEEFDAYVEQAKKASDPFRYLVKTVSNERHRIAEAANSMPRGPMGRGQDASAQDASDWRDTKGGVNGRAAELGLPVWDECEPWPSFKARIVAEDQRRAGGNRRAA